MIKQPIGTLPAALPAENEMEAALKMFEMMSKPRLPFYPVLDGYVLTAGYNSSIEQGLLHNVPFMAGSTRDDLSGEAGSTH